MTAPRNIRSLEDVSFVPGECMFRSKISLFGFIPVDYSDVVLLELNPGESFIEQSQIGLMKSWKHERMIVVDQNDTFSCTLRDKLTFEPRRFKWITTWLVKRLFEHRHGILRISL